MRMRAIVLVLCGLGAAASPAAAQSVPCEPTEADAIELDGMLDDWAGVRPVRSGKDAEASYDVRCLVAGPTVWLAIDVRDERVVRGTRGGGGDDRLELAVGGGKPLAIALWPGAGGAAPKRTLGGKAAPGWLGVEDTLQQAGWSAELRIPLAKVPGWSASAAGVPVELRYLDGDIPKGTGAERTVTWSGALAFAGKVDLRDAFLADARLGADAVVLDASADVDPTRPGAERVIAAGDRIALVTDRFVFVTLPVARATDVVKVSLLDLRGDASRVIAAHVRLRGGGVRDLVMLWRGDGGALVPAGAFEIAREHGDRRLHSTWKVAAGKAWRKQTGGAAKVIEVRAQPAVGWDEDSYHGPHATDAEPIHVPWDDDRVGGVFWLGAGGRLEHAPIKR